MEIDHLIEVINDNPNIDRTAIDRSRQAAKQLAEVGITLGGYRLTPALGGAIHKPSHSSAEQAIVPPYRGLRSH